MIGINVSQLGNRIRGFEAVFVVTGMTHLVREMRAFSPLNFMLKVTLPFVWPES